MSSSTFHPWAQCSTPVYMSRIDSVCCSFRACFLFLMRGLCMQITIRVDFPPVCSFTHNNTHVRFWLYLHSIRPVWKNDLKLFMFLYLLCRHCIATQQHTYVYTEFIKYKLEVLFTYIYISSPRYVHLLSRTLQTSQVQSVFVFPFKVVG